MKHEFMDFSRETHFREELLRKIKAECFAELEEEDLSFVNAAGVPEPPNMPGISRLDMEKSIFDGMGKLI